MNTIPSNGNIRLGIMSQIDLIFDSQLEKSDFSVTSSPSIDWKVSLKDQKIITLSHKEPLTPTTKYQISVLWKNENIAVLNFTTEPTQTDYTLIENIKNDIASNYPLASHIPYETNLYQVVYSAPMTLEITMKTSVVSDSQAISQVKSWVSSQGGDSGAHKYVVISASPTPTPSITPSATTGPDL